MLNPATVVTCDTTGLGLCFTNTCNPDSGACLAKPFADGSSCDEGCLFVPEPDPRVLGVAALASLGALARQRARA